MALPTEITSIEYVKSGGFVEGILVTWDANIVPAMIPSNPGSKWRVNRTRAGVTENIPVQSVYISPDNAKAVYINLNDDDLETGDEATVIFLGVIASVVPAFTVSAGIV